MRKCRNFKHKCEVYNPPTAQKDSFDVDLSNHGEWTASGTGFYCEVKTQGSTEVYRAQQSKPEVSKVFIAPWNQVTAAVTSNQQLRLNGKQHHIYGIVNLDEENRELHFEVTEFDRDH